MIRHVFKYNYGDDNKLGMAVMWCGRKSSGKEFKFQDAQHVALAAGVTSITPCKSCINAIIRALEKEL